MENLIPILFDVPEHYVRVETFVASAEATQRVVQAFSSELFGDKLIIHVVVVAPEPGSLRQILKVSIKIAKYSGITIGSVWAVIFSVIQALETDIGKAAVEGFTEQSPSEIAKEVAKKLAEIKAGSENQESKPFTDDSTTKEVCGLLGELLSQMSSRALASPRQQLDGSAISPELKFELTDAQADVFEACMKDDLVKSIEFEDSGVPPIPRSEFAFRAVHPARPEKDAELPSDWAVSIETVVVTSPNFVMEDQESRKWKGRTQDGKPVLFTIEDQEFWSMSHKRELKFSENTILTVQMATRVQKSRSKEIRVVRVMKIDNLSIGNPLDENALKALLGSLEVPSIDDRQGKFF